jgi:hypothetical protein
MGRGINPLGIDPTRKGGLGVPTVCTMRKEIFSEKFLRCKNLDNTEHWIPRVKT